MFTQTHYFFSSFSLTIKILSETQKYPKHIRKPGQEHSNRRERLRGVRRKIHCHNQKEKKENSIEMAWNVAFEGSATDNKSSVQQRGTGKETGRWWVWGRGGGRGKQPGEAEQTLLLMERPEKRSKESWLHLLSSITAGGG